MDLVVEGKAYVQGAFQDCCIGIDKGKIVAIKKILKGETHYRFPHRLLLPAGIDLHVHFRDPGMTHKEDFSSGSLAAAFGGISCIFDMPNTQPQTTTRRAITEKNKRATATSYVDFGLYVAVSDTNLDNLSELAPLCHGFKMFLGQTTRSHVPHDHNLSKAFETIASTGKLLLVHAENYACLLNHRRVEHSLDDHLRARPALCEEQALKHVLQLVKTTSCRLHVCHVSSAEGMALLRNKPPSVSCGITPHHALLHVNQELRPPQWYKVNPPLRTSFDQETLFDHLRNGIVDILESDHAPHTLDEKNVDFDQAPSGIPGVETMYPLFLYFASKGVLSFPRLLHLICEKPAELMNLPKGRLAVGNDADFMVIAPSQPQRIQADHLHSKCGWTPFHGWKGVFPSHVFLRGNLIVEDHEIVGAPGMGQQVTKRGSISI
jgi:dihydroorotase